MLDTSPKYLHTHPHFFFNQPPLKTAHRPPKSYTNQLLTFNYTSGRFYTKLPQSFLCPSQPLSKISPQKAKPQNYSKQERVCALLIWQKQKNKSETGFIPRQLGAQSLTIIGHKGPVTSKYPKEFQSFSFRLDVLRAPW